MEHNLLGTVNLLEYCKQRNAGLILLSSSPVYSVAALTSLPLKQCGRRFVIDESRPLPTGVSPAGIGEEFSTQAPVSLYGSTKRLKEALGDESELDVAMVGGDLSADGVAVGIRFAVQVLVGRRSRAVGASWRPSRSDRHRRR